MNDPCGLVCSYVHGAIAAAADRSNGCSNDFSVYSPSCTNRCACIASTVHCRRRQLRCRVQQTTPLNRQLRSTASRCQVAPLGRHHLKKLHNNYGVFCRKNCYCIMCRSISLHCYVNLAVILKYITVTEYNITTITESIVYEAVFDYFVKLQDVKAPLVHF